MADENAAPQASAQQEAFVPITSQEQFDALIQDRIERAKASTRKEYADYESLKSKAAEYDKLSETQMTELEKANKRAQEAERERDELRASRQIAEWSSAAAKKYNVPVELIRGTTEEEVLAHAKSIAEAMKPKPPYVGSDGGRPNTPEKSDWIRDMFNKR